MWNKEKTSGEKILLFDGICNLCSGIVFFVIKRNSRGNIRFASLQSEKAGQYLAKFKLDPDKMKTFVLIEYESFYLKSDAALRLFKGLDGFWSVLYIFILLPKSLRDLIYDIVAGNRYRLFGKKEKCMVPTPDIRNRFIDW